MSLTQQIIEIPGFIDPHVKVEKTGVMSYILHVCVPRTASGKGERCPINSETPRDARLHAGGSKVSEGRDPLLAWRGDQPAVAAT